MMLLTGNEHRGFTLVEVMVATAVLALGAVLIYEIFFGLVNSYNYYVHYLEVSSQVNEKIWEAQDSIQRNGDQARAIPSGSFRKGNKSFNWNASLSSVDREAGLYRVRLSVDWQEGRRRFQIARSAYALYDEEKE